MTQPETATYIAQLKSSDYYVRRDAARTLGKIGDAAAVPALIRALKQPLSAIRFEAAFALGEIGDASAASGLIEVLQDRDEMVRRVAASALSKIGDAKTLPRKVVCNTRLSAQEKINLLEALRRVEHRDSFHTLSFSFPETRTLCQHILQEEGAGAQQGAQEILNILDGNLLLRASQRDTITDGQELLRAAPNTPSETPSEALLRASDPWD